MPKIKTKISFEKSLKCKLTDDFDIKKSTKENTENPLAVVFHLLLKMPDSALKLRKVVCLI